MFRWRTDLDFNGLPREGSAAVEVVYEGNKCGRTGIPTQPGTARVAQAAVS